MWKWIVDSYSQRRTEHQAETPERNATTRSLDQRQRKWLEWMLTTSIPLVHLDAADLPIGAASGCFIDYRGRRFLLSVQHAIERGASGWVVRLGNNRGDGSTVFALRDFNYVGEIIRARAAFARSTSATQRFRTISYQPIDMQRLAQRWMNVRVTCSQPI